MKFIRLRFSIIVCMLFSFSLFLTAQRSVLEQKINIVLKDVTIREALKQIEKAGNVSFAYSSYKELNKGIGAKSYKDVELSEILNDLFEGTSLSYKLIAGKVTIYISEERQKNAEPRSYRNKTSPIEKHTISGYVFDDSSGEVLIGATVYDKNSKKGTVSNAYGYYSLNLLSSKLEIEVSMIGYEKCYKSIVHDKDLNKDFRLKIEATQINEISIRRKDSNPLKNNSFPVELLSPKNIEALPITFGENDVIKAIQMKTGVKSLGEGSSGVFVQGGNTDQNLMLIDEAPVYNPAHLFGLVSVFNPDAIKNVEFYKGVMPAEFGGKISSVINCQMNDGNTRDFSFKGGIGTLTSHFSVDGPLIEDKVSFLVAGRRSIRDLFQNPSAYSSSVPQFYDINAKLNWKINEKNRIFLSFYNGRDEINTFNDYYTVWGNSTFTARWTSTLSSKLFLTFTALYSDYYNNLEFIDSKKDYQWLTGVEDVSGKIKLSWYIAPGNTLKLGLESCYHRYIPGESGNMSTSLFRVNALEHAAFVQHDIDIGERLGLNYGLRYSVFQNVGEAQWNVYDKHIAVGIDSNEKGVYKQYAALEPRITLNLRMNNWNVVKLAYAKAAQYSQVLQNSIFSYTSIQTWMPGTPNVKPLRSNILSLGYFSELGDKYRFSAETYLKRTENVIDYIDHALLLNYPYIESQIRQGLGKAHGISLLAARKVKKLDLELTYTYSRVLYQIDDINNGELYPALHDIPHDLRLTALYKPVERLGISAFWNVHSGYVLTLPVGNVSFNNTYFSGVAIYSDRNSARMPVYHRLDMSVFLYPKNKDKRFKGIWSAGVYNAYGRMNPIGVNFSGGKEDKIYVYNLYRVIPYISYNFKF